MIDFIIPHMGRPELLKQTVDSILNQSVPSLVGKIFVVSKNETAPELTDHPALSVISMPKAKTISEQRNYGVSLSEADIIVLMDADIELSFNWVDKCHDLLEKNPQCVAVSAQQKSKFNSNVEKIRTQLNFIPTEISPELKTVHNLMLYKKYHDQIGGFPEHLMTCEDIFYLDKLSELGTFYCTDKAYYHHLGEDHSLTQTFTKEIWRSEYNVQSLRGRPVPLREWPSILMPFWIALCILFAVFTVKLPMVSLAFLLLSLVPPLLYSLRLGLRKKLTVNIYYIFLFYCSYFAARTIGTLKGLKYFISAGIK